MADQNEKEATPQAIVGLLKRPGGSLAIMDANKAVHECADEKALWDRCQLLLADEEAPTVDSKGVSAEEITQEKLSEAFDKMGEKIREMAEDEYGAPLVDAASTIANHAGKKAGRFLRGISRKKNSSWKGRRRRSA